MTMSMLGDEACEQRKPLIDPEGIETLTSAIGFYRFQLLSQPNATLS